MTSTPLMLNLSGAASTQAKSRNSIERPAPIVRWHMNPTGMHSCSFVTLTETGGFSNKEEADRYGGLVGLRSVESDSAAWGFRKCVFRLVSASGSMRLP